MKSLDWLGLNWDEGPDVGGKYGPYTQSERKVIYKTFADYLIDCDKAYRCQCTPEYLDYLRKAHAKTSKDSWKYPGLCRHACVRADVPHVIRLKTDPTMVVSYDDLVFGKVTTPISSLYDFVIMRENGIPLYNFASVIDDYMMKIDLVARGCDHMINTPSQILLYHALGCAVPSFAHLPMLLNMNGAKLAKRDGTTSVDQFKSLGFSANGLLNYLMRFGWGHGDQELFSLDEMIKLFSWDFCKKSDGKFDFVKASAINAKNLMNEGLVNNQTYLTDLKSFSPDVNENVLPLIRGKAKSYIDAANLLLFLNDGSLDIHPDLDSDNQKIINDLLNVYSKIDSWNKLNILETTKNYCNVHNLKFATVSQTIRYWLTNKTIGPDIYDIMVFLGKDRIK